MFRWKNMEILNIKVTQIILVHYNEIPLLKVANNRYLQALTSLFGFDAVEVLQDQRERIFAVQCRNGFFEFEGSERTVERLNIEERRVQITLEGSSQIATALWEKLREFLIHISGVNNISLLPVIKAQESEIIAHLDFSLEKLISPSFYSFMTTIARGKAALDVADAFVKPTMLNFQFNFVPKDNSLNEQRISLVHKDFSLALANGRSLSEQIYYSKAPFDTDTHVELLEDLNASFLKMHE